MRMLIIYLRVLGRFGVGAVRVSARVPAHGAESRKCLRRGDQDGSAVHVHRSRVHRGQRPSPSRKSALPLEC